MRINAAIRLFTYDSRTQLQRCRLGQGKIEGQLAGAALDFLSHGAAPPSFSLDLPPPHIGLA
jgi:hypothetical protein